MSSHPVTHGTSLTEREVANVDANLLEELRETYNTVGKRKSMTVATLKDILLNKLKLALPGGKANKTGLLNLFTETIGEPTGKKQKTNESETIQVDPPIRNRRDKEIANYIQCYVNADNMDQMTLISLLFKSETMWEVFSSTKVVLQQRFNFEVADKIMTLRKAFNTMITNYQSRPYCIEDQTNISSSGNGNTSGYSSGAVESIPCTSVDDERVSHASDSSSGDIIHVTDNVPRESYEDLLKKLSKDVVKRAEKFELGFESVTVYIDFAIEEETRSSSATSRCYKKRFTYIDGSATMGAGILTWNCFKKFGVFEANTVVSLTNFLVTHHNIGDNEFRPVLVVQDFHIQCMSNAELGHVTVLRAINDTTVPQPDESWVVVRNDVGDEYEPLPVEEGETFPFCCNGDKCSTDTTLHNDCIVKSCPPNSMDFRSIHQSFYGQNKEYGPSKQSHYRNLLYIAYERLYVRNQTDASDIRVRLPRCVEMAARNAYPNKRGDSYEGFKFT